MWIDILKDAFLDNIKMLPFLLAAFFVLELAQRYSDRYVDGIWKRWGKAGPAVGALLGCIPQCGFSALAANLFGGGMITPGTLLAVFLATSDEAVFIMLGNPGQGKQVLALMGVKALIGMTGGFLVDSLWKRKGERLEGREVCTACCHEEKGSFRCALEHTLQLFVYLFLFTAGLNLLIELLGVERISALLLQNSFWQPAAAVAVGLIPNCASSILLTEMYLEGMIGFASVTAGLSAGAGVGLLVLFKANADRGENWKILGILVGISLAAGFLMEMIGL